MYFHKTVPCEVIGDEESVPSVLDTGLPEFRSTGLAVLVTSSTRVGADVALVSSVLIWVDVCWL